MPRYAEIREFHYEKVENDKRPFTNSHNDFRNSRAAASFPGFDRRRTKYLRSRFPPRQSWSWQRFRDSTCVFNIPSGTKKFLVCRQHTYPDFQRTCRPSKRKCRSFAMARRFRCADKQITRPRQKRRRMKSSL